MKRVYYDSDNHLRKKKTALILFGEYRTFETVSKYYNLPVEDYDIYIQTWNRSIEERVNYVTYEHGEIQYKSVLNDLLDLNGVDSNTFWCHYQRIDADRINKHIKNTPSLTHDNIEFEIHSYEEKGYRDGTSNMVYHYKKGLEHIRNYCHNKPVSWYYDSIALARIDGELITHRKQIKKDITIAPHTLYHSGGTGMEGYTFANDVAWYGSTKTMESWIDGLDPEKHFRTHIDLAVHTGEWIEEGGYRDYGGCKGVMVHFLRAGAVPFIDNWKEIKEKDDHGFDTWHNHHLYQQVAKWCSQNIEKSEGLLDFINKKTKKYRAL